MNMKKVILLPLLLITCFSFLNASPTIEARIDDVSYDIGDIVTVRIKIDDNPGIKGLFFDLSYDSQKMTFLDFSESLLLQRIYEENKLLYAHTNNQASLELGGHVIVSWFITEKGKTSLEEGTFAEIRFRVKERGLSEESFQFSFSNNKAVDIDSAEISQAVWQDSAAFILYNSGLSSFVDIVSPRNNEVVYSDSIILDALFTDGTGYKLIAANDANNYISSQIDGTSGSVVDLPIPVIDGTNQIELSLFDQSGERIARDQINVIKSSDSKFVKIVSPANHSLVNTNMVKVIVSSAFENPKVNGLSMEALGEFDQQNRGNTLFFKNFYLKEGFNTLTVEVQNEGAIYTDEIDIYYHKDDSVFRFVSPGAESVIKITDDLTVPVKGEISSRIDDTYLENTVHIQAVYHPRNTSRKSIVLVNMEQALIKETDLPSGDSTSAYIFELDNPIQLSNLDSGSIELIAYKNKRGGTVDDEIHRSFYIDSERLYIDLVQPNIHTEDILDTEDKVKYFNNGTDPTGTGIVLNENGSFVLNAQDRIVESIETFNTEGISDILRLSNGDVFALVNDSGKLKIYKNAFGGDVWSLILEKSNLHGYDLCETDLGLLVGVSNLYNNENSGLYILRGNDLVNISIGEPIPHVQFINEEDGLISLYGNDYSYLYTFNIFSLEENGSYLKAGITDKYEFDNNYFIQDFHLTSGGNTAVIHTLDNEVHFYTKSAGDVYKPVIFQGGQLSEDRIAKVVKGEYVDGDYNAFLLIEEDNKSPVVVMEHKSNKRFIINRDNNLHIPENQTLIGVDFFNNLFSFVTYDSTNNQYNIKRGQILFDSFFTEPQEYSYLPVQPYLVVNESNLALKQIDDSLIYLGYSGTSDGLYCMRTEYPAAGNMDFLYSNSDIEGLISFSIEADSSWVDNDALKIGFSVEEYNNPKFGSEGARTIKELLEIKSEYFSVYSETAKSSSRSELITVVFADMQPASSNLFFNLALETAGGLSPEIRKLSITKKVPVKLPRTGETELLLPIKGYIYDPTVREISIGTNGKVQVENGQFSHLFPIDSVEDEIDIRLYCENIAYESAEENFTVQLFDSVNTIDNIVICDNNNTPLIAEDEYKYTTEDSTVKVSGSFTGLIGLVVGFEVRDAETDALLKSGIFEKSSVLEDGMESGTFSDQIIELFPDEQTLNIYVENPGGLRTVYTAPVSGKRPEIYYNLPLSSQEIKLTNFEIDDIPPGSETINDSIVFDRKLNLTVNENPFTNVFEKEISIRGQIFSNYDFQDLKVKSYNSEILFEDGSDEILINVDAQGRFEVSVMVTLPEEMKNDTYSMAFIPTAPFLHELSRGLIINAEKSLVSTNVIPQFDGYMDGNSWETSEIQELKKPVRVRIDRFIPDGTKMTMIVNYEEEISGVLKEVNPDSNVYKLMDGYDEVSLKGAKLGNNRIQWWISYDNQTISTSASSKTGMVDFLFNLTGDVSYVDTSVTFDVIMQEYYDQNTLPQLIVSKDINTSLEILFNEKTILKDSRNGEVGPLDLTSQNVREGKNSLKINSFQLDGTEKTFVYEFMFDSKPPHVEISGYTYSENNDHLLSLSAVVEDYNLRDAVILYTIGGSESEYNTDPLYTYIGDGRFEVFWDLSSESFNPSVTEPIKVKVTDHAGHTQESDEFHGIADGLANPNEVVAYPIIIEESKKYHEVPYFEGEAGNSLFEDSGRAKFFSSSVGIEGLEIDDTYKIVRPDSVHLSSTDGTRDLLVGGTQNGSLIVEAGQSVVFHPGFSVKSGSSLSISTGMDEAANREAPVVDFTHDENYDSMSFAFYYRYEQEDEYSKDDKYKRILTLFDYEDIDAENCESIYLASKNTIPGDTSRVSLYLVRETGTKNNEIYNFNTETIIDGSTLTIDKTGFKSGWNLILLSLDRTTNSFSLAINNKAPLTEKYLFGNEEVDDIDIFSSILNANNINPDLSHYFGSKIGNENGHFSIAQPFYVNRTITIDEVPELESTLPADFVELDIQNRREYNFDSVQDDIGTEFYNLRSISPTFYSSLENSDYNDPGKGSLFARSEHKNYLKFSTAGKLLIFADSVEPAMYDVTASGSGDTFTISPTNGSVKTGRYFLSKKQGNHGLTNNKFYSVYGTVKIDGTADENDPAAAWLVLLIDGKETRIPLRTGQFHLVYDNQSGSTPSSVKLYIETTETITFEKDIVFTEGDYILPEEAHNGLEPARVETLYPFSTAGTVDLWYKPININNSGFSSYPVTIFDSEYLTLFTRLEGDDETTKFSARLKGDSSADLLLESDYPVTSGWHNLQLSYSVPDNIVYFYVDGKIAAMSSGSLPVSASMKTYVPNGDNMAIGGALAGSGANADGFIDSVYLSRIFQDLRYEDNRPVVYTYKQNNDDFNQTASTLNATLDIEKKYSGTVDSVVYTLESRDGSYRKFNEDGSVAGHGFDINAIPSGAYNFRASMIINGYRFDHRSAFIKNNRPNFSVQKATPLIVNGIAGDIGFGIRFDDSYLLQSNEGLYPGFALQIRGSRESQFDRTLYVFQDPQEPVLTWKYEWGESADDPLPVTVVNNELQLVFDQVISVENIEWELRSFYFENSFVKSVYQFDRISADREGTIPIATLSVDKPVRHIGVDNEEIEYKLLVKVGNKNGTIDRNLMEKLSIVTRSVSTDPEFPSVTEAEFKVNGTSFEIYYDDLLPDFGLYNCTVSLRYENESVSSIVLPIIWKSTEDTHDDIETTVKQLSITDFALLYLDRDEVNGKIDSKAKLYLEFKQSGIESGLYYDLDVYSTVNGDDYSLFHTLDRIQVDGNGFVIINDIPVPENSSKIILELYELEGETQNLLRDRELLIRNESDAPEVVITNTVPNRISYNNVLFTWKGFLNGSYNSAVQFSYNFDRQGWTTYKSDWTSLELYDLEEGYHLFEVKASYNSVESVVRSVPFFVDIQKPQFDLDKIVVVPNYEVDGIIKSARIHGNAGSVTDSSLSDLFIGGKRISFADDGSFPSTTIDIRKDGLNEIICAAFDEVGNKTEQIIKVDNSITDILFPSFSKNVYFAPATLVGSLNPAIVTDVEIYLSDPETVEYVPGDFSGWKKAKINSDRTFFVEDVYINPGSIVRTSDTSMTLAVKTKSGLVFTRDMTFTANQLILPIEMTFSSHAVEGENAPTLVQIDCKAHVDNISSWSIDYTGDGIYDDIVTVDNPLLSKEKSWSHTYSSLGLVSPRVRVITTDGNYFSVSDQIIIHEQIMESSNLLVNNPESLSSIRLEDGTDRVFVLAGSGSSYRIETYEIGRNDNYISDKLFTISLEGLGIDNPVDIHAIGKETLLIASNRAGSGYVYTLEANEFGNYVINSDLSFSLNNPVRELEKVGNSLFISVTDANYIAELAFDDGMLQKESLEIRYIDNPYLREVGANLTIAGENDGLIVADYSANRILSLDPDFRIADYYDDFGVGEREFQRPSLVETAENRVFIFDEVRKDIQIFDSMFNSVATLRYTAESTNNYMEETAMDDLKDMTIVIRNEGNRLYYYALMISGSTGKLSMIRLPQWEELRASVRNNKIVFLKDREIFTAKPDGSDLRRVLSSDSIPRIEGVLDYPAISPDGRKIVFTSRVELYDGNGDPSAGGNQHAYDNLYMVDITGENLTRIPLGIINNFEIERPVFSTNGDRIICSAKEPGGNWQIYTYNLETGGISKLFSSDENVRFPYYSPDDRFVVFTTDYDGDEEVVIADVENVNMRVAVTSNNTRDSYPVWSGLYPYEISNTDLDIDSKIAFVSERDFKKTAYFTYISRPSESDIRIVKKTGEEIGSDPDSAAMEITSAADEADYPSFTGDGQSVVFEYQKDWTTGLMRYDFKDVSTGIMNLPEDASKPAGMKNMIVDFDIELLDGDDLYLSWDPYTDKKTFYTVQFRLNNESAGYTEKKFFTDGHAVLNDMEMGSEYLIRVCIVENGEEAATTLWKKMTMPVVAARAEITVDEVNPYLVHLKAWKPTEETQWQYSWIIDNQEIPVQSTEEYLYEFSTSGTKTIMLKTSDSAKTYSDVSDPETVRIISDIVPSIEYVLPDDSSYVELSAENSLGERIDWASAKWTISGPGQSPLAPVYGSKTIIPLDIFKHKVNVNLALTRIPVNGQVATDTIEKNITIDLDFKDVKPVITYDVNESDPRLFTFSGSSSIGNIDWYNALWTVYGDGIVLHQQNGKSSISYRFPESGSEITYTVSLTVPRISDGQSETATQLVSVEPAPLEPVIDYEIITLEESGNTVGAKVLFSCSNSKGSSIDFSSARWSVPVAGAYGEQPTQIGPTAIYNLFNADGASQVEVSLTLMRKGGSDAITVSEKINLVPGDVTKPEIVVKKNTEKTSSGHAVILDALSSTGPNIDWERTQWLVDGQYAKTGPVVRYDLPNSGEEQVIRYVCTLFRHGDEPITDQGEVIVGGDTIKPLINLTENLGNNVFRLSVEKTEATNVDWTRTTWYIFDGNENVVKKQGSNILHTFVPKSEAMGYPVMVEMFFQNDDRPFVGYKTIDIEGDELVPVITWDLGSGGGDANVINFSAQASSGSGIDWSQTKWTFGDSSESQYGASVSHEYTIDGVSREYKVSLTLLRRSTNGVQETATVYKTINIASNEIKPVLKAQLHGDGYLVLTSEASEGRGLMLDRTSWLFEGEGDSQSLSLNTKEGTMSSTTVIDDNSVKFSASVGFGPVSASSSFVLGDVTNTTTNDYSDFIDKNESFSTSNSHTGATCRRYVGDQKRIVVTMFVYRMSPDGGMTGESITVNVDCDEARSGVSYE
ncbi:PKD domain-containing protein [Spirochaeta isovalerica]|uniref:Tol biopolymer transport system component n=1 Tax=Spirochaeta isovalerica TaxID=150 RepID=A0A841R5N9_9SPIO|nr:PKD domain-containing protein [Spirochaeta isovalerica]MBB6478467.1 Tol biopolymer transport system component [Spirochaeta isovalerica]